MTLTRNYPGGSDAYQPTSSVVQVAYTVAGTDGASVDGQINTNYLLSPTQLDELCNAMMKACGALPWVVNVNVSALENGRRSWTVSEDSGPQE